MLQAGQKIGKYELERELGEGAMAEVWQAHDPLLERRVALKILRKEARHDKQYVARFLEDARAAVALDHPNIVRIVDVDNSGEAPFIIMELVDGQALDSWLKANGPVPPSRAVQIARELALALSAAHAANIVHRDIKPSNMLVETKSGRIRLTDFGAAKRERTGETELTTHGQLIGTPRYMAPEQINGEPVDPRTDLFALGVTLYELLAGKQAYTARTREALFRAILIDDPPDLKLVRPELPEALVALTKQLMAKSPDQRPASALDVAKRLEPFVDWQPPAEPASPASAPPPTAAVNVTPSEPKSSDPAPTASKRTIPPPPRDPSKGLFYKGEDAPPVVAPRLPEPEPERRNSLLPKLAIGGVALVAMRGGALRLLGGDQEGAEQTTQEPVPEPVPEPPPVPPPEPEPPPVPPPEPEPPLEPLPEPEPPPEPSFEPEPSQAVLQFDCDDGAGCAAALAVFDLISTPVEAVPIIVLNRPDGVYIDGDFIVVDVIVPDQVEGYLYVNVLTDAGEVYHLMPEPMRSDNEVSSAGRVRIGVEEDARAEGVRDWQVGPPFGPGFVVAIVSATPLWPELRPIVETLSEYMAALEEALADAPGPTYANATRIEFQPRP